MRVLFQFTNGAAATQAAPIELGQHITADDTQTFRGIWRRIEQLAGAGFHVGPRYYANLDDADRERRRIAKQLFNGPEIAREIFLEKLALYSAGATQCPFCMCAITEIRRSRSVGSDLLHLSCAERFDRDFASIGSTRYQLTEAGREALADEQVAS
jgi:hypothetical protein